VQNTPGVFFQKCFPNKKTPAIFIQIWLFTTFIFSKIIRLASKAAANVHPFFNPTNLFSKIVLTFA
jgi:hypothetical protein